MRTTLYSQILQTICGIAYRWKYTSMRAQDWGGLLSISFLGGHCWAALQTHWIDIFSGLAWMERSTRMPTLGTNVEMQFWMRWANVWLHKLKVFILKGWAVRALASCILFGLLWKVIYLPKPEHFIARETSIACQTSSAHGVMLMTCKFLSRISARWQHGAELLVLRGLGLQRAPCLVLQGLAMKCSWRKTSSTFAIWVLCVVSLSMFCATSLRWHTLILAFYKVIPLQVSIVLLSQTQTPKSIWSMFFCPQRKVVYFADTIYIYIHT